MWEGVKTSERVRRAGARMGPVVVIAVMGRMLLKGEWWARLTRRGLDSIHEVRRRKINRGTSGIKRESSRCVAEVIMLGGQVFSIKRNQRRRGDNGDKAAGQIPLLARRPPYQSFPRCLLTLLYLWYVLRTPYSVSLYYGFRPCPSLSSSRFVTGNTPLHHLSSAN